jgi:hypothetical protein
MFFVLSVALISWTAIQIYLRGARGGLWWGWLAALLLVPSWFVVHVGALTVDMRTIIAITGLAGLLLFGRRGMQHHWLAADSFLAALVVEQIASEYEAGQFGLLTAAEVARVWLLPYLVGRCFLGSSRDVNRVLPAFAWMTLVLSLYGIIEAVTHVNPLNELLAKIYGLLEEGQGYRWGLKRAQAFFDHPIYFGYLLVLVLPWVLQARRQALRGDGPSWWKLLPFLVAGALICTASRGPLIAGALSVCVPGLLARPRWWVPVLGLSIVAAAGMVLFQDTIVDSLAQWAGEDPKQPVPLIIGGQEMDYTGTSHRLILFQAYEGPVIRLGPLGYGSLLLDDKMDEVPARLRSIDDHYLLFLLQRGPLGLGLFVLLALVTLINLVRSALDAGSPTADLAAGLFGAMTFVTLMLFTVWFAPDFGVVWLFVAGLASNLQSLRASSSRGNSASEEVGVGPRPRLGPGHAPCVNTNGGDDK